MSTEELEIHLKRATYSIGSLLDCLVFKDTQGWRGEYSQDPIPYKKLGTTRETL